jgi:hypothetical protein
MKSIFSSLARGVTAGFALLVLMSCGEDHATDPNAPHGLVECPTNQTLVSDPVLITPLLGGVVSLGNTSITIPAGALSIPRFITVTIPASKYMEVDIRADDLTSLLFNTPVSVTIDYSRCALPPIAESVPFTAWYIDPVTKKKLEDMRGTDDKAKRQVRFNTGHLSNYAIAF